MPRVDCQKQVVEKAQQDDQFRKDLLGADPTGAIEQAFHLKFPAGIMVTVHEEQANEFHVVIPARTATGAGATAPPRNAGWP